MSTDVFECTEVDSEGHARLKAERAAVERFAKVTAGCPCDRCPMAKWCEDECRTFRSWVQTGKC